VRSFRQPLSFPTEIHDICCGPDRLVYVLASVRVQNKGRITHVFVYDPHGEFLRRWAVDGRAFRMCFGPNDQLYVLGGAQIEVCGYSVGLHMKVYSEQASFTFLLTLPILS